MHRAVFAELLGSMLLSATVIGSGIMAERLAGGNAAIALLANTGATMAALGVLIVTLGPRSGAHFNPAVSLVAALRGDMPVARAAGYVLIQVTGCCLGAILANSMFDLPPVGWSTHVRTGGAQWLSEVVATAGLVWIAFSAPSIGSAAWRVSAWIGAAYWFTASTSFANPAITLARSLSDTFSGIRPVDVPGFAAAQVVGASVGHALLRALPPARVHA